MRQGRPNRGEEQPRGLYIHVEYDGPSRSGKFPLWTVLIFSALGLVFPTLLLVAVGVTVWFSMRGIGGYSRGLPPPDPMEALEAEEKALDREIDPLHEEFTRLEAVETAKAAAAAALEESDRIRIFAQKEIERVKAEIDERVERELAKARALVQQRKTPKPPHRKRGPSRIMRRYEAVETRGLRGSVDQVEVIGNLICYIQLQTGTEAGLMVQGPENLLSRVETLTDSGLLRVQGRDLQARDRVQVSLNLPALRVLVARGNAEVWITHRRDLSGRASVLEVHTKNSSQVKLLGDGPIRIISSGDSSVDLSDHHGEVLSR